MRCFHMGWNACRRSEDWKRERLEGFDAIRANVREALRSGLGRNCARGWRPLRLDLILTTATLGFVVAILVGC